MKRLLALVLLLALPTAQSLGHIAAPTNVRVDAGSQILTIHWDPVDDDAVRGYLVRVHGPDGTLVDESRTNGTTATTRDVINDRSYAVQVAALDENGQAGAWSAPVGATPTLKHDQTYLALGLIVVWLGIWVYALALTRIERNLRQRFHEIQSEKERLGERP